MHALLAPTCLPPCKAFQCRAERRRQSGQRRMAVPCRASAEEPQNAPAESMQPLQQGPEFRDFDRRSAIFAGALAACTAAVAIARRADAVDLGAAADTIGEKVLCNADCVAKLNSSEKVTTKSGLQYVDIVPGKGPNPQSGYQVVVNYVAMTPEGRIFDNSLAKNAPYFIRVGTGQVVAGLDEALLSMQSGGVRRVYIPGPLAFPKGLPSGPGRPRILPSSPVVFDVQLAYIPGISDDLDDFEG